MATDKISLSFFQLSNTFTVADKKRLHQIVDIFSPTTLREKPDGL